MYRFALLGLLLLLPQPSFADFTSAAAAARRGDHAAAYEACKAEIEKDPECQNLVGVLFQKGLGVAANPTEALRLFRRAADRKLAAAQVNLGLANLNGIGVPKDEAFAARWFAEAAKQGDVVGEFEYGTMLISGKGGDKDTEKGIEYLKHGADRGYVPAQVSLAVVHELKRQPATAYVWYRVAGRIATDPEQRRFANLGEQRTLLSLSGQQIPLVRTAADHWKPTGPTHFAFQAPDRDTVNRFHTAALSAGGKDNGGPIARRRDRAAFRAALGRVLRRCGLEEGLRGRARAA